MSPRTRGLLLATFTAVLWGTVPVAGKVALGGLSAPWISVLRLASSALLLGFLLARAGHRPWRRPHPLVVLGALGLGGNYVLYMAGLETAGAGTSQVLIQVAPLFLVLLGVLFLHERPQPRELVGGLLAFLGVALVSWREVRLAPEALLGVLLVLAAALAWSVYAVAHKLLGRSHASGGTTTWIFLLSAFVVLPTTPFGPARSPDPVETAAILYLCLNTVAAYWSFGEALRHVDASTAGIVATLGPAITFALLAVTNAWPQAYVPYEAITALKVAGAIVVVAGVGLAVTGWRR